MGKKSKGAKDFFGQIMNGLPDMAMGGLGAYAATKTDGLIDKIMPVQEDWVVKAKPAAPLVAGILLKQVMKMSSKGKKGQAAKPYVDAFCNGLIYSGAGRLIEMGAKATGIGDMIDDRILGIGGKDYRLLGPGKRRSRRVRGNDDAYNFEEDQRYPGQFDARIF